VVANRNDNGGISVTVTAPDATVETTVIVVQLRDLLQTYERQERADRVAFLSESPLPLPERTGTSPYFTFTYTVLIPVLVFLPVFISGSLVVDSITEEIDEGTFELLRVAPVTLGEIVDGKALAAVAIAPRTGAPVAPPPPPRERDAGRERPLDPRPHDRPHHAGRRARDRYPHSHPIDARRSSSTRSACWSFSVAPRRWPAGPRTRSLGSRSTAPT